MKISNEIKVGILAIVAIAVLIFGYRFLEGKEVFKSGDDIYAIYTNASSLDPSDAVVWEGFQIGSVQSVELYQDTLFRVRLRIKEDIGIPIDSRAEIYSSSLMGGKAIEIIKGKSERLVKAGDVLTGDVQKGIQTQVQEEIAPFVAEMQELIDSLTLTVAAVTSVFDDKNVDNLSQGLANVPSTLQSYKEFGDILVSQQNYLNKIMGNLQELSMALAESSGGVSGIVENVNKTTDQIANAPIDSILANLAETTASLNALIEKANSSEGSLGLLINDPSLYNNISKAALSADELLTDFKKRPDRYMPFKTKKKREE